MMYSSGANVHLSVIGQESISWFSSESKTQGQCDAKLQNMYCSLIRGTKNKWSNENITIHITYKYRAAG